MSARLCSGDPSIYSALAEQTRRLDEAGVDWDVTPGVPAYAAAAAIIGRELTVPELAQTVILTRTQAASTAMPETESWPTWPRTRATMIIHLAIRRIRQICAELTPAYGAGLPGRGGRECDPAERSGPARHPGHHRRPGGTLPACGKLP